MKFEFATAGRIVFGPGALSQVGSVAAEHAHRYLVVVGSRALEQQGVAGRLVDGLAERRMESVLLAARGEPDVESVDAGALLAADSACDGVIGLGGGSAIDTAKAIAALLANTGQTLDYMEVVGRGQSLSRPAAPIIAIPTTAGTGSEVTRNAVIGHRPSGLKASLRSPHMLPRVALVDPVLTHSLPPAVTATTGLDALTQLIEPYVSKRAQPLSDALAKEGLPLVARSLARACSQPDDASAREDMALASLLGGLALANAGLGPVHGFAAALGGSYEVPHGAACAALLPHVMEINVRALLAREPDGTGLRRYAQVAEALLGKRLSTQKATIDAGVEFVRNLCGQIGILPLAQFGVTRASVPAIVARAESASSMKANPIALTREELAEALSAAIG